MPTQLKRLKFREVSFCAQGANQEANVVLYKSLDESNPEENAMIDFALIPESIRAIVKAELDKVAVLTKENGELKDRVSTIEKSMPKDPLASIPLEIRKRLEDAEAAIAVEKMRREHMEWVNIVKSNSDSIACDAEAMATALRKMDKVDSDVVIKFMTAANTLCKSANLTKSTGTNAQPTGDKPEDKLMAIAKKFVQDNVEKDMDSALRRAGNENPALYREFTTSVQYAR